MSCSIKIYLNKFKVDISSLPRRSLYLLLLSYAPVQFDLGLSTNFLSSKFGYYIRCIERITTASIRLPECAAWSAPLLFACN